MAKFIFYSHLFTGDCLRFDFKNQARIYFFVFALRPLNPSFTTFGLLSCFDLLAPFPLPPSGLLMQMDARLDLAYFLFNFMLTVCRKSTVLTVKASRQQGARLLRQCYGWRVMKMPNVDVAKTIAEDLAFYQRNVLFPKFNSFSSHIGLFSVQSVITSAYLIKNIWA